MKLNLRFENWECYVAGKIGLAAAVDYATNLGVDHIRERIESLARRLHDRLQATSGIEVYERSSELSGLVTFTRQGCDATALSRWLHSGKMNSSVSKLANARLDLAATGEDVNRASVHYFNTEDEVDRFVAAVASSETSQA